ncbi:hypothetical protein D3C81_07280 [compost metagenome]
MGYNLYVEDGENKEKILEGLASSISVDTVGNSRDKFFMYRKYADEVWELNGEKYTLCMAKHNEELPTGKVDTLLGEILQLLLKGKKVVYLGTKSKEEIKIGLDNFVGYNNENKSVIFGLLHGLTCKDPSDAEDSTSYFLDSLGKMVTSSKAPTVLVCESGFDPNLLRILETRYPCITIGVTSIYYFNLDMEDYINIFNTRPAIDVNVLLQVLNFHTLDYTIEHKKVKGLNVLSLSYVTKSGKVGTMLSVVNEYLKNVDRLYAVGKDDSTSKEDRITSDRIANLIDKLEFKQYQYGSTLREIKNIKRDIYLNDLGRETVLHDGQLFVKHNEELLPIKHPIYGGTLYFYDKIPLDTEFYVCNGCWRGKILLREGKKVLVLLLGEEEYPVTNDKYAWVQFEGAYDE